MNEATIRRAVHDRCYTVIANAALQDESLSWKARGLLSYLLSLPDNWRIYVSELASHAPDGEGSTRTAFKELQAAGYIKGEQEKDANNQYLPINYVLFEKPHVEKPNAENCTLQSTHEQSTHEEKETPTAVDTRPGDNPGCFEGWLDLLRISKNKQAVLARMAVTLFPAQHPDGVPAEYYGRIGRTAKHPKIKTYDRLAQLLWQASMYRPTGDIFSYCVGLAKGDTQADTTPGGDRVIQRDGKPVAKVRV